MAKMERLASKLGAPSGRVCFFLLSSLRSRAKSEYIQQLLDFNSDAPEWAAWPHEQKDAWMADYILERLEESIPPSRFRTLLAALQKIGCAKWPKNF